MSVWNVMDDETPIVTSHREKNEEENDETKKLF